MAKYWNKMSDEAIREYEAEVNDPSDPTDDELTDINVETLDTIMNFLDDLHYLETYELENEIIPTDADLLEIFQYAICKGRKGFVGC